MLDDLDLFYGRVTDELAQVYVRHRNLAGGGEFSIRGRIHGPYCEIARTIASSVPLRDAGPGETLLAQADVPEPCTWSPELPAHYEVEIELMRGGECVVRDLRRLGIRRFGPRGKSLYLNTRRYVLRGIHAMAVDSTAANGSGTDDELASDLEGWRRSGAAIVIDNPSDALCDAASRQGVLIVARIDAKRAEAQLRRLSRWASVAIVVIDGVIDAQVKSEGTIWHAAAPNVVLAQSLAPGRQIPPTPWAQLALCEFHGVGGIGEPLGDPSLPIVACRSLAGRHTLQAARAACDSLQRVLSAAGLFAGYIV